MKRSRLFIDFGSRFEGCFLPICLPFSLYLSSIFFHLILILCHLRLALSQYPFIILVSLSISQPSASQPLHRYHAFSPVQKSTMRITSVTPYVVRGSLSNSNNSNWNYSCLVRIETDTGLLGWGEGASPAPQPGWGAPKILEMINTMFAPTFIGRDPTEPMVIWEELQILSVSTFGPPIWTADEQKASTGAISAIDIALWDINGQAKGQPICKLLTNVIQSRIKVCVDVSFNHSWLTQFSSDSPWQPASAAIPEAHLLKRDANSLGGSRDIWPRRKHHRP